MKDKIDKLVEEREKDYNKLQNLLFDTVKKWEKDSILSPKEKQFDMNVSIRPVKEKSGTYIEIAVPQPSIKGEIKNYIQMIDSESNVIAYIFIL